MSIRPIPPEFVAIEPVQSYADYWRDVWMHRRLLGTLSRRDINIRYKQTVLGCGWVLLKPLLTMLVFTVLFGRIAHFPSEGHSPYPILVFSGLLPWQLFAAIFSDGSVSLVTKANLVTKVYFPRLIVPLTSVAVALVDFAVALLLLFALMVLLGVSPTWRLVFVPLFALLVVLASLGPMLFFAGLTAKYRDVSQIMTFVLQLGMYISPVAFSATIVPPSWRIWYDLNPLVGAIDGFRWCILGLTGAPDLRAVAISVCVSCAILLLGLSQFRRMESEFADVV
jgi:lipopolysaccharide transport system permease protein